MSTSKFKPILSNILNLPTPSSISYLWNFGSILGLCLIIQIISGLFLAFHYCASTELSFNFISHIMRDVNYGWLIRFIHANGASMFFIFIYTHIGRGLYYSSYNFMMVWISGILIIFLLMATAFIGYVLPWGQMSFWGATVITNLLSAIPYVGEMITLWIWGGFSINNATLTRFFSLHFILPFILLLFVIIHIFFLHETGSSNPTGIPLNIDKIPFHPYFSLKDFFGYMIFFMFFIFIIFLKPFIFFDPDNFIPANSMVTPIHIQPEWYFLFAYCILRTIPNKLGGVIALILSILIIISLPFSMKNKFNPIYLNPLLKSAFWFLVNSFILLTFLGSCPIEAPFTFLSLIVSSIYFLMYLLFPLITILY